MKVAVTTALLVVVAIASSRAQIYKPAIELTPAPSATLTAGTNGRISVRVKLPSDVHVQSDKPNDPSLIPTALVLPPLPGVTLAGVTYPEATPFQLAGRATPLVVFGPEFTIDVQLSIAPTAKAGEMKIPAQLRYQACNERVCFAPARAVVEWTVKIQAAR